ncbi:hypothetical protein HN51_059017, partial [Arachis hypogaea]
LSAVMCIGVAAGAYILTLFAISYYMKYRQRVLGLILVSPLCKEPSWTEWLCNKVLFLSLKHYVVLSCQIYSILWHVRGDKGNVAEV